MAEMTAVETAAPRLPRRRFLAIAGAAAGLALMPAAGRAAAPLHHWRGVALGAEASIRLRHPDAGEARRIIALAVQEIERLERIFSLYRPDSAVSRLNRQGRLAAPPLELVELLSRAATVSRQSGGAFDVTVQPLWARYRDHFAAAGRDAGSPPGSPPGSPLGPPPVADVLPLVDWRALSVAPGLLAFERPGMAITLNGIAQGFVTDRIAELLRRNGIDSVLLDLGEIRGLGEHPDGRPWRVAVADPAEPSRRLGSLDCSDVAVATSGGYGLQFDGRARFSHLLDPRNGGTAPAGRGITVTAAEATLADAWSTAFAVMEASQIPALARQVGCRSVHLATPGRLQRLA